MRDFKTTKFIKRIALTEEHYDWVNQNKGKKSAAGFLEQIIDDYKKPNLFKKNKMTFEDIKNHPLWGSIQKKFPYRDYEFQFGLLLDWYETKKKKQPKNISAFTNWLEKTKEDPNLRERANKERELEETLRQRQDTSPKVSPETLASLKQKLYEKIGKPFPKHETNTHDTLNDQAKELDKKTARE